MVAKTTDNKVTESEIKEEILTCGIIMPIASMGTEYPESHWIDIRNIIETAIKKAGFKPRIVSDSEDSTIIHKSIINNIYADSIIVCDVSNKNANVMFELGMRLAFNKPVVIIKDDKTGYSFDTGNIQHLGYRKDLRHSTVEKFIDDLAQKIKATHAAPNEEGYQSFLTHFGKFEVATIENKSIPESEALQKLLEKVTSLESKISSKYYADNSLNNNVIKLKVSDEYKDDAEKSELLDNIATILGTKGRVYYDFISSVIILELPKSLSSSFIKNTIMDVEKIIEAWELPF